MEIKSYLPVHTDGSAAVNAGLGTDDVFNTPGGEVRRVVYEPGKHLTRGDYGDPIYAETAFVYRDGDWRVATSAEYQAGEVSSWKVWDSDYGWL